MNPVSAALKPKPSTAAFANVKNGLPVVLALGGGAYVSGANAELVDTSGISIWLDTPFETIRDRVSRDNHRPLAADPVFFHELFLTRRDSYAKASYTIQVASNDPAVTLNQLLELPIFDK